MATCATRSATYSESALEPPASRRDMAYALREEEEEEAKHEDERGGSDASGLELFDSASRSRTSSSDGSKSLLKEKAQRHDVSDASDQLSHDEEQDNMRSPSRLATSLLLGRDRMARAARAWRDGARRAGFFGGDENQWGDDDDEETKEESRGERARKSGSVQRQRDDQEPQVEDDDPQEPEQSQSEPPLLMATWTPMIPRLALSRLAPSTRLPKMAQLWMFLDRIEFISVGDMFIPDEEEGAVYYILDVYHYQEQHSIPTQRRHRLTHSQPPQHRQPDYQIQQRFSSFTKLKSKALHAARRKHHSHCEYCQKIMVFLTTGSTVSLGWKAKMFTTVETRKVLLGRFITELVGLTRERVEACTILTTLASLHDPPNRAVQFSIPGLVKRFLTVQTGENFMRR